MDAFRRGAVHLMVGTTVLEVGVHVPGATAMVIEHPERFGLAQLHQLRGRVGREGMQGLCLLMISPALGEKAQRRLKVLVENNDGFEIAQKDLEGTRQAGIGELDLQEIMREGELFSKARQCAMDMIEADPDLELPEHRRLSEFVHSVLARPIDV